MSLKDTESESSSSEDSEDEDSEDQEEEMEQDIPTGKWRQGKTAQKGQELLLRFATKGAYVISEFLRRIRDPTWHRPSVNVLKGIS